MARKRRILRQIQPVRAGGFDEQLWPINLALLVLLGFAAGLIYARSDFETTDWLRNGWVHLGTLLVTTIVCIVLAIRLGGRRGRRFQLAALLSLLIHLGLGIGMVATDVLMARHNVPERAPLKNENVMNFTIEPDRQPDDRPPTMEHDRPIEVSEPEQQPQEMERQDEPTEVEPAQMPTPPVEQPREVEPSPVERVEVTQATPRRSEQTSQLSRQSVSAPQATQTPVEAPQMAPATSAAASAQAASTSVSRAESAAMPQEQPTPVEVPTEPTVTAATPTRRQAESAPAEASEAPQLTRSAAPQVEATAEAAMPTEAATPTQAAAPQLTPSTDVARQETSAPTRSESLPEAPATQQLAARVSRQTAGATPTSVPDASAAPRAARAPSPSAEVAEAARPTTTPAPSAAAGPEAPTSAVAKSSTAAPSQQPSPRMADSDVAAGMPSPTPGSAQPARREQAAPGVRSPTSEASQVARAAASAPTAVSPSAVESPSLAQSPSTLSAAAQPSRAAISRSTAGAVGASQAENFERGLAASQQPTLTASAAARREVASSTSPAAPGVARTAADIPRSTAGTQAPTASMAAVNAPAAELVGSSQPSDMQATASATTERSTSAAPPGEISAETGLASVDTGATQVVGDPGMTRAAGGGQPDVGVNTQGEQLARAPVGGATPSIDAAAMAEAPAAPAGASGGAPSVTDIGAAAADLERTPTGGGAASGSPSDAMEVEPAGGTLGEPGEALVGRAVAGEALPTAPSASGAAVTLARRAGRSPMAAPSADASIPEAAMPAEGGPASGGAGEPQALAAAAGGAARAPSAGPTGAAAGSELSDVPVPGVASALNAPRSRGGSGQQAPSVDALAGGPSIPRASRGMAAAGTADAIELPQAVGGSPSDQPAAEGLAGATGTARGPSPGLPVEVAAETGVGGLGPQLTSDVGLPSRFARRDAEMVHLAEARITRREIGGPVTLDGRVHDPTEAFRSRKRAGRGTPGGNGKPPARTEEAIELGLAFLARHQSPQGNWSLHAYPGVIRRDAGDIQSDTAATGLALLAFLGAGYDHIEDRYRQNVRQGLDWLLANQATSGDLYVHQEAVSSQSARLYSHGLATIALCEAYGMTRDESLREPAQRAINFIVSSQEPQLGGWRYTPQVGSDTSVTGWQLMALKSGELAGLEVPRETYQRVEQWLEFAADDSSGGARYVYDPDSRDEIDPKTGERIIRSHMRRPSPAMTAAGLLMRLYSGWDRTRPEFAAGAKYLAANPPSMATIEKRDTYYWYYATQVMFHMQGDAWKKWNDQLHPLLVGSQVRSGRLAGSWDPQRPIKDRWADQGGRIYVTTLNLLSLEVYYRHLPIYGAPAE